MPQVWEVQRDTGGDLLGRYRLGSGFERARAVDDGRARVLLWRSRPPQERAEYDDDERRRARSDRCPVDAVRLLDRIRSREFVDRWTVVARLESRGARPQSDVLRDDPAAG